MYSFRALRFAVITLKSLQGMKNYLNLEVLLNMLDLLSKAPFKKDLSENVEDFMTFAKIML